MRLDIHDFATVEDAREWGKTQIDSTAGKARARYITVAEGQETTYLAKYTDAKAYLEAGSPESLDLFPWIKNEALRTDVSADQAARRIKQMGDYWNFDVGPRIESARMAGKDRLEVLESIPQIISATRIALEELNQI